MEMRVARLEDQFSRIDGLLRAIEGGLHKLDTDVAELKGRIAGLPTTWAMIVAVVGGQLALAGLLFAAMRLAAPH